MISMDTYRSFWAVFLSIAIIGTITWLAIFEHNYHPRIYRSSEGAAISLLGEERAGLQLSTWGIQHLVAEWEKECGVVAEASLRCMGR